jgi:hypothetical protein
MEPEVHDRVHKSPPTGADATKAVKSEVVPVLN